MADPSVVMVVTELVYCPLCVVLFAWILLLFRDRRAQAHLAKDRIEAETNALRMALCCVLLFVYVCGALNGYFDLLDLVRSVRSSP